MTLILGICAVILLFITSRLINFKLFSPLLIQCYLIILIIFLSIIYYYFIDDKINLYNMDNIDESSFLEPLKSYLIAINALLLGFLAYYFSLKKSQRTVFQNKISLNNIPINVSFNSSLPLLASSISLILDIALLFITYGEYFWRRSEYLYGGSVITTFTTLIAMIFIVCNVVIHKRFPIIARCQIFIFLLANLTTGSRKIVILYLLYAFLSYLLGNKSRKDKLYFLIALSFSAFMLPYVLILRSLPSHGLIPYLSNYDFVFSQIDRSFNFTIYYMTVFSYFVTANVMMVYNFNWNNFLISINPLPGVWVGWYDIMLNLNFGTYIPYNSFGEVFSGGAVITGFFYFVLGFSYAFIEKHIRKNYASGQYGSALLFFILMLLSIISSHQYNLRSMIRLVYYCLVLILLLAIYKKFIVRKKINE